MAKLRNEGHSAEPTERFSLAPLPTSSLPVDQQPLGAADRLLASPALGEPSTATGAFMDGRIYLRGESHLFSVGGDGTGGGR